MAAPVIPNIVSEMTVFSPIQWTSCPKETLRTLFGDKVASDPGLLAQQMDADNDKMVTSTEFMHYAASQCNYLEQAIFKIGVPRSIRCLEDFTNATFYEIPASANWKRQMKRNDKSRIISVYTDYITRGDVVLEQQDKLFAVRQGWKAAIRYLRRRLNLEERVLDEEIVIEESEDVDEKEGDTVVKVEEKVKVKVEEEVKVEQPAPEKDEF